MGPLILDLMNFGLSDELRSRGNLISEDFLQYLFIVAEFNNAIQVVCDGMVSMRAGLN